MNVKPGDLAIIKSPNNTYNGRIVEVISAAPVGEFLLPDGARHLPTGPGYWVIKFVGGKAPAPLEGGGTRKTMYGVGVDRCLFPLPGESEACEFELAETI